MITGAINWELMINLGVIKSEDTNKGDKNAADNLKMVTRDQFMEVLKSEVSDNKYSKTKKKKKTGAK